MTPLDLVAAALLGGLVVAALCLVFGRTEWLAHALGATGAVALSGLLLGAALLALLHSTRAARYFAWALPGSDLRIGIDPLSAFFLLPVALLVPACALGGLGAARLRPARALAPGTWWFFFHLLAAAMALVVVARDAVVFLIAWETMVLAAYFLMVLGASDGDEERAAGGGLTFLIASHLGTAALLLMFLQRRTGEGALWSALANSPAAPAAAASSPWPWCWLALAGFGTKAALVPFHPWVKESYGGAPGEVGALLSGVMSKLGFYGLLRMTLEFAQREPAPRAFAWVLLALGLLSLFHGVLIALSQRDVRRVLAGTSIESAGLIATALAAALLGRAAQANAVAVLAMLAALLHVLYDALFKGLLFLGAGAVRDTAGTDRLDRLGGLLKLMPTAGLFFVIGAAALAALPPLNGFVSELLLVTGAFEGAATQAPATAAPLFVVVAAVALAAALALAAMVRLVGSAFLGIPRDAAVATAREPPFPTRLALLLLALLCLASGLFAPLLADLARPVLADLFPPAQAWDFCYAKAQSLLGGALLAASLLALALLLLTALRFLLLRRRPRAQAATWDCGYHRQTSRMQSSASSLSQPLVTFFAPLIGFARKYERATGLFAAPASYQTKSDDPWRVRFWQPLSRAITATAAKLRILQHGRLSLYVLAIAATLLALLVFELAGATG